ncbi:MAG: NADPH:quinone oxidoreductase family protein [Caulobacterales bacterium]
MRAILSITPGKPDSLVLRDAPEPEPSEGEIVIAVKAAAVNFPDVLMIEDLYQFKPPRPFSPGGEVAGIVKKLGAGVTRLKIGDRVLANNTSGGFAEAFLTPANRAFKIPDSMPFDDASAFLMTYGTSQHALTDRAQAKRGETLLVLGAAGGVGLAAVELGKAYGLKVIAAASSQEKVDFAKAAGADAGIVYPAALDRAAQKTFSDAIKAASGGGVDIVYDGVGGDYAEPALRALNWEGRYLVVGFPAGIPKPPLNLVLLKGCQIMGVFWGAFTQREPERHEANISALLKLYTDGRIKPKISKRYSLEDTGRAIEDLAARRATGKIVVMVNS